MVRTSGSSSLKRDHDSQKSRGAQFPMTLRGPVAVPLVESMDFLKGALGDGSP